MAVATISDGTLYYTDHRKADSPFTSIILIHGAGGSHLDWHPSLRRLPEANAIAIDLPGHGKSTASGRRTIEDFAADIVTLVDEIDLERAIFAGHSMGGAITQMLALLYPERVESIILIGTGAKLGVHSDILHRVLQDQEEVGNLLKTWIWAEDAPTAMREIGYARFMENPPQVIYDDYSACNAFDIRSRLGEIDVPALVIGGTQDQMTPAKYSAYLADHIKDSTLFMVEDGGHMMALEQPQTVADAVKNWLIQQKNG